MRDAHQLAAEPDEIDLIEREAEHEAIASGLRAERQRELDHVELTREVLDRPVIRGDAADPQRRHACLRAELRDDLLRGAHATGRIHRAASLRSRPTRGTSCAWSADTDLTAGSRPILSA